jgi:Heparinase II/III-like protein
MPVAAARTLRPFDRLFAADRLSIAKADEILDQGWKRRGRPPIRLVAPLPWDRILSVDRSWGVALHAWEPLAPLLAAYDQTRLASYLRPAVQVALDWGAANPAGSEAWTALPAGRRMHRLAYLIAAASEAGEATDLDLDALRRLLAQHVADAPEPGAPLEDAIGRLAVAARFPDDGVRSATVAWLGAYFGERVAEDGGPLEHSPGVLWGELRLLDRALGLAADRADTAGLVADRAHTAGFAADRADTAGLAGDRALRALIERADAAIAWLVTPSGWFAPFGDSDGAAHDVPADVADPHLGWALSGGRRGAPPAAGLEHLPAAGFAVVRVPRGRSPARASYLAQIACFHSTRHKHADELSFVWHERGVELLTDPGRYALLGRSEPGSEARRRGFRYADPRRRYVESTGAHNTVEIDGRSDARVASRTYGAAPMRTTRERDAFATWAEVRREGVRHSRVLAYRPGIWLVVLDVLTDSRAPHDLIQRFHFGPDVQLQLTPGTAHAGLPEGRRLDVLPLLGADAVSVARGQEDPLLGWHSPAGGLFEPVWCLSIGARSPKRHVFATAFVISESGARPAPELVRANASGTRARLGWVADGRRHQVDLSAGAGELVLRHRAPKLEDGAA